MLRALLLIVVVSHFTTLNLLGQAPPTTVRPIGSSPDGVDDIDRLFGAAKRPTREEVDAAFERNRVYKGTFLESRSEKERDTFVDISLAFFETNPIPPERISRFGPVADSDKYAVVAWEGEVTELTRRRDGTYHIVMKVRPDVVRRGGGVVSTQISCIEHWNWDGKNLTFKEIEPSKGSPKFLFVD